MQRAAQAAQAAQAAMAAAQTATLNQGNKIDEQEGEGVGEKRGREEEGKDAEEEERDRKRMAASSGESGTEIKAPPPGAPAQRPIRDIFVSSIAFEATAKDLREFFKTCGTIVDVRMPKANDGR